MKKYDLVARDFKGNEFKVTMGEYDENSSIESLLSNQPERSKREDCICEFCEIRSRDSDLINKKLKGDYISPYCRCGALNTMET